MNVPVSPIATRSRRALAATALCVALFASFAPFARMAPAAAEVSFNQRMLELVNATRAANGVAPVQWSAGLGSVAENGAFSGCATTIYGRSHDMGLRNYFSHTIKGCTHNVGNMVVAAGVSASALGENIAWSSGHGTDPAAAAQILHNQLMSSPNHKANILSATFTHVGVGSWRTAPGKTWTGAGSPQPDVWIATQVFGKLPVTTAPVLSVSPPSLTFSSLLNVVTLPQTLTVQNTGTARMTITGTMLTGSNPGDFGIGVNTCVLATLAPGSSCNVALVFTPKAVGSRGASLSIMGDAPGSVPLSGTGTAASVATPGAPTNVVATGGDGQIGVTWGAAPAGPIDAYAVWAFDAAGYTNRYAIACATCTSATVTGLANGKPYYAIVAAFNAAGQGAIAWSGWVTVAAVPAAPADVRLSSLPGQLTATWKPSANAAAAAIDSYAVLVFDANGFTGKYAVVCATCTTGTVTGLTTGAWYYVGVYAHNPTAWGAPGWSEWMGVGAPTAPQNLRATPGNGQVGVTWSAPASNSGSPITGYMVLVYDAKGYTGRHVTCPATCTGTTVTGLTNGSPYAMVVHASNANGWGVAAVSATVMPA